MAIKKVYYNGSSKIIKAICNAINDIIDSGGGGGSSVSITPTLSSGTKVADYEIDGVQDALYAPTQPTKTSDLTNDSNYISDVNVAIQKDASTGTVTTTLTSADNNLTFVNNKAQFEKINIQGFDVVEISGDSASGYTLLQKLFSDVLMAHISGSGSAFADLSIVLGNDYFFEQGGSYPQGGTGIVVKGTSIRFINDNTYDAQSDTDIPNEIVLPHKAGTVALLGDIPTMPTKLSDLTDDVVAGNYLPLSGGTMTGAIKLTATSAAHNTSPSYLLAMDTFASGGEVKYTNCSEVTVGAANKIAGTKASVGITAASGITLTNYSYKIGNIVTLSFMTDPFTAAATWSNKSIGTVASGSRPQSVMIGHVSNGSWIGLIRVDTNGKITAQTIAGGAISSGYVAFNCCYVC